MRYSRRKQFATIFNHLLHATACHGTGWEPPVATWEAGRLIVLQTAQHIPYQVPFRTCAGGVSYYYYYYYYLIELQMGFYPVTVVLQ
jgi:hypothetical protein